MAGFLSPVWHHVAALRPTLQPHAAITRQRDRGRSWYAVHNAATGQVHRFSPAVYSVLDALDGRRTVNEAWTLAAERLEDAAPTQDEVVRLLAELHEADLLAGDLPPDAEELARRRARQRRSTLWQRAGNPLALRIPVWDPDRFLRRTLPAVRPLLGRFGLLTWAALVLPALVAGGMNWATLTDGAADRILATENLLLMALVFPVLKLLHEMAHAYAVRAGGGEVHEMGVMLLVLLPIPYVDASASAVFRSRARRVGVSAAGMLAETGVAAAALLLWTVVEPGALRSVLFAGMVTAGLSTVVFNANPLLRYDGYFILSDLLGIPNLAARAARLWTGGIQRVLFGLRRPSPPLALGERKWLVLYAPASLACRLFMAVSVAALVAQRFSTPGILLAAAMIGMTFVVPAARALWFVAASPVLAPHRLRALGVSLAGLVLVALMGGWMPAPLHTVGEGVTWLPEDTTVRAGGDGFLRVLAVAPGTRVAKGTVLAVAADPQVEAALAAGRARVAAVRARLAAQEFDDQAQAGLVRREMAVEAAALARSEQLAEALTVRAAASGVFVVPHAADVPGRWFRRGDVVGYVLPDRVRTARVLVDQDSVDLVRNRLDGAEAWVAGNGGQAFPARLVREVPAGSDELPSTALAVEGGGSHATDPRDRNKPRTLSRTFQFDVELPAEDVPAASGMHVWVRFNHGSEPLATQGWRLLRQTVLARFDA